MSGVPPALDLRVVQYNTLARSAADTVWFPYAVSRAKTSAGQLGNLQNVRATREALERAKTRGTVFEGPVWTKDHSEARGAVPGLSVSQAVAGGAPEDYFDQPGDCGTFSTEVLSGEALPADQLGVTCVEGSAFTVDSRKIVLSWSERLPLLLDRIQSCRPDLVFLEEVDADTLDDFRSGLPGFEAAYAEPGCCLLWRLEALAADGQQEVLRYSDGKKVAVLQPLRASAGGVRLLAAVTHLHWDPRAPLQLQEARELLEALDARSSLPVVLGGDFNAGGGNAVMADVLKAPAAAGSLRLVDLQDVAANAEAVPKGFTAHCPRGPQPKLTDARHAGADDPENPVAVDYVFAHVPGGLLLEAEALDCGRDFGPAAGNGLPSLATGQGSDHLPVAYRIRIGA